MTIWQFDENMIEMLKGIVGKRFLAVETDDFKALMMFAHCFQI